MGFRFQKRIKLFGGFGLNISKSGISWSARGLIGTFGSKRISIKTGLTGLTYVSGRKIKRYTKKKNEKIILPLNNKNFDKSDTDSTQSNFFSKIINAVSLGFWNVIHREDSLNFSKTNNQHLEINPSQVSNNDIVINKSPIALNLEIAKVITIMNLSDEFKTILIKYKRRFPIVNPFYEIVSVQNDRKDTLETIPIFDICRLYSKYGKEIYNNSKETEAIIFITYCLTNSKTNLNQINIDSAELFNIRNIVSDFSFAINPIANDQLLIGPIILKNDPILYSLYLHKLKEVFGLISTLDYNVNKNENEIFDLLNSYRNEIS
ncbi:MAG: DUF4236 domain-containing protein [Bacteroidetes bacterium]|nr:DUF4236 domain-containing protein [Bacteroidota bacterium]